jgi:hypothetical protein
MKTLLKARERDGANTRPAPTELQQLSADMRRSAKGAVHLSVLREAKQSTTKDTAATSPGMWFLILAFVVSVIYAVLGADLEVSTIDMGPETAGVLVQRANTTAIPREAAPREEHWSGPQP